jgi:Trypsin-like peptidase domain/NACHT domain
MRDGLEQALRAATVPLTATSQKGTGFFVASGLVLTCAHVVTKGDVMPSVVNAAATPYRTAAELAVPERTYRSERVLSKPDLILLHVDSEDTNPYVCLAEPVQPGDELWTFGYPDSPYRSGDSVTFRYEGISERKDGTTLLKVTQGRIRLGFSGAPVLNWRTGAVCGVIHCREVTHGDTARLIPVTTVLAAYPELARMHGALCENRMWLDLLDDAQLAAAGIRYPGPQLRSYLTAAREADRQHPYAHLLPGAPPLAKVYLKQQARQHQVHQQLDDPEAVVANERRVDAATLAELLPGVQVIGGPGAGKSSLIRHITAVAASKWLNKGIGEFIPVPVAADSLTSKMALTEALAAGIVTSLDTELDQHRLTEMFSSEPLPGVPWLILVDGLDEILNPHLRDTVLRKIVRYQYDSRYRFIVTNRPLPNGVFHQALTGESYPVFVIEPFSDDELFEFAMGWFKELGSVTPRDTAGQFMERLERTKLRGLANIPLISTMMCILFSEDPDRELPFNRSDLYGRFVDWLLSKHQDSFDARARLRQWVSPSGPCAERAVDELLVGLRPLLQGLAHHRQFSPLNDRAPIVSSEQASTWGHVQPPSTLSTSKWNEIVREVFRISGLLVQHGEGFRFLHRTIEEYLAARYLADMHPDAQQRTARGFLAPQERWPWQHLEVKIFLAALWIERGADLAAPLNRLLRRRHRRENIEFIVELHRQGVTLPERIRRRLIDILVKVIADPNSLRNDWLNATKSLVEVDQDHAVEELTALVMERGDHYRRFESALALVTLHQEAGVIALERLADEITAKHTERLSAVRALKNVDPNRATVSYTRLALDPQMGILQADAADAVASINSTQGISLLQYLARSAAIKDSIRLKAARMLIRHDRNSGLHSLAILSESPGVEPKIRLDAAIAVGDQVGAESVHLFLALLNDHRVPDLLRLNTAVAVCRHDEESGVSALASLADDRGIDSMIRIDAARQVANSRPREGLQLLLRLTADTGMAEARVTAGKAAGELEPMQGADALSRLSEEWQLDSRTRLTAALAARDFDPSRGLSTLINLARSDTYVTVRLDAAEAVANLDRTQGIHLLLTLAKDGKISISFRLKAARVLAEHDPMQGAIVLEKLRVNP